MLPRISTFTALSAALFFSTIITAYPTPKEEDLSIYSYQPPDPPQALPQSATDEQLRWQPALDFDTDGCYNVPAIDANGTVAIGLTNDNTGGASYCHDPSDLDNNNVYVRTRCNNGWCAHLYDYYFEKDVAVQHIADIGGHRHDWEHVAVFVQDDQLRVVAASQHGHYKKKRAEDIRMDGDHPKIVYNKGGGSTHAFRFAHENDDIIENANGTWFRGALVDYDTGFPGDTREILMAYDFGRASIAIKNSSFEDNLNHARNYLVEGFDSSADGS